MLKVFLVEDEIIIREGIQKMVPWGDYGFELSGEAADGEIALPLIRQVKPDVVVTDIKMPFMDGLSLSTLIKKEMPQTKIVIISGYDDFSYAQQAISVGVERYLLKPVSKNAFIEVLEEIRNKYEMEHAQKSYYEKFVSELQEYEKNSRRDFFEALVSGELEWQSIYEKAEKLKIDILAESYNMVLYTMNKHYGRDDVDEGYSQSLADMQNCLDSYFAVHAEYLLFRNHMFNYAVVIKGTAENIGEKTKDCMDSLKQLSLEHAKNVDWFVCSGEAVERLSMLPKSYELAMQIFSCRYMYDSNVISDKEHDMIRMKEEEMDLKKIDSNAMNPEILHNFMSNGLEEEIERFVENYFRLFGEQAMRSKMFRQYVILNIHFGAAAFLEKLGIGKDVIDDVAVIPMEEHITKERAEETAKELLHRVIELRDENAKNRYRSVLDTAVEFIEQNYMDENLSLNVAAQSVNVSANHFSALFSQEMGKTFIEYVTDLRMRRAKELLRCSNLRSGEIALEVGYKDAHYFSFLFKKIQGCTPSEYRKGSCEK